MELRRIDRKYAAKVLPFVEKHIKDGVERACDDLTEKHVWDHVTQGAYTLWLAKDGRQVYGSIVTSFVLNHDSTMNLAIITMACDAPREEWLPLLDVLEKWGRQHGCIEVEMTGRPGWPRVLKDWNVAAVTMSKPL